MTFCWGWLSPQVSSWPHLLKLLEEVEDFGVVVEKIVEEVKDFVVVVWFGLVWFVYVCPHRIFTCETHYDRSFEWIDTRNF